MAGEGQQRPEGFSDRDLTEESHEQHHVTYRHHLKVLIGSGQPEARFIHVIASCRTVAIETQTK